MRILFVGKTDFSYNRTDILWQGLQSLSGVEAIRYSLPGRHRAAARELAVIAAGVDIAYVPPFRHRDLAFVQRTLSCPVIFDPLISRYLTKVVDYGHYWKAPQKYLADFRDFRRAQALLADTQAHLDELVRLFKLPEGQPRGVLPVGVHTDQYQPAPVEPSSGFRVGFYGSFVPLQGTRRILEAAYLLKNREDIQFTLIGDGHAFAEAKAFAAANQLSQVHFPGRAPSDKLPQWLTGFDLCLGIFGDSLKADLVVPNKVYHYAALGKCVLSKDTPAMREVFVPGKHLMLCEHGAERVASQILALQQDPGLRESLGRQARQLMVSQYSHLKIAERFVAFCQQVLVNANR